MRNSNEIFTSYITIRGIICLICKYLIHFTPERLSKEINKRFRENQFKEILYSINHLKITSKNKSTFSTSQDNNDEKCK